ncbi:hypothetical protein HDF18_11125 [Mucilaginibacter sp. X5P1]|uniref:hypothetical protein n=1 Tax=Mucilaginibacter sp. X5P1 TaxID=2723088 RepID=UPI001611846C|nr:hypothetical protein [Mucilaginibacter sp. X5P1]MBB6140642.1 hypothetical protein [Mucilaginibacter sp. X5P1]
MEQIFTKHINELFKKLIDTYGFKRKTDLNENESYMILFASEKIAIRIEKYFRELYTSLYKVDEPDFEVNLFNLLDYLIQDDEKVPQGEYFHREKDLEECYKKQLTYVSSVIDENYDLISDFFNADKYELRTAEFEKYWRNKHPEFYGKV